MAKRSQFDQLDRAITTLLAQPDASVPGLEAEIAFLARIAAQLRNLPRTDFIEKLKSDLERSSSMATTTHPVTAVRTVAVPRLIFKDAAKAIEFYTHAFGAKEIMRFQNEGGIGHAEIMIGDSVIAMGEEWPEGGRFSAETLGSSAITMQLRLPDVDAFVERAVEAGATLIAPVSDQFYGDRVGTLVDPFGYVWSAATRKEEISVEEMHRRFRAMQQPEQKQPADDTPKGYRTVTPYPVAQDADGLIEFVKQVFDAQETFRSIGSAGGIHAEVRIGDSMMMIGGGGPGLSWRGASVPMAFHIYVPDCDATYERALEAGASTIAGPADQFYGERSASVKDPAGNYWYIATRKGGNYKWEEAPTIQPYLHPLRAEPVINFLKSAFGAHELGRHATPDGVIHHVTLTIGDSHVEMGEAQGPYQPMPSMFYLNVPDCDAVYRRALAAGATSITEPADQSYGARSGGVKDAFGNQWYIATPIKGEAR